MTIRRLTSTTLASLCALAGALALTSTPAHALLLHTLEPPPIVEVPPESKCPGASFPGPVNGESNATVDSGHLWFNERVSGTSRTEKFSATSPYACERQLSDYPFAVPNGVAVGHATGEEQVYVGYREGYVVVSNGESGATLATWNAFGGGEVDGVAVDNNGVAADNAPADSSDWAAGDVLVAVNGSQHVVDVLKPKPGGGEEEAAPPLTGTGPGEPFNFPRSIAIDDVNGDVFVMDRPFIDVFEPGALGEYRFVRKITGTPSGPFQGELAVAVDGSAVAEGKKGQLYVIGRANGSVDEFSLTGEFLGGITNADLQQEQPGASFGADVSNYSVSVAVDPVSHHVFASVIFELKSVVDGFGPNVVVPDVVTEPASNVLLKRESRLSSATLNGMVDPDEAGEATCRFEWGTSKEFGKVAPCEPEGVADGGSPVPVHAALSGLEYDTTYYFRLQATNKADGQTNLGEASQDQEFTTPGPGGVGSESVVDVTSSSATFDATIDPNGAHTSYRFEYDTSPYALNQPGHGVSVPSSALAIGSGGVGVGVEQRVVGLASGGTYHYRVVAVSEVEVEPGVTEPVEFDGPDRTFTTQSLGGVFSLPDNRAWELVSPPDKHGALIGWISESGLFQASVDGGAFTFVAEGATEAEPQGVAASEEQVLSSRCASGSWSSQDIATPHSYPVGVNPGFGFEYRFFSEDLSRAVVEPLGRFSRPEFEGVYEASPVVTERTPYLRDDSICPASAPTSTPYQPVVSGAPGYEELPPGTKFNGLLEGPGDVVFVGGTPDAEHVVIESGVPLTVGGGGLYEWSAGAQKPSERLRPLYLLPESEGGGVVGGNGVPAPSSFNHQLSDDGSVFFDSGGHLYLQDVARGVSGRLDVAQGVPEPNGADAGFIYASSDGSRVFFSDPERLTSAAGGGVYECRVAEVEGRPGCAQLVLTGISASISSGDGSLIGGSQDASYLYFVSKEALASGSALASCKINREGGWEGASCNLYVYHAGSTTFIATLSGEDSQDWGSDVHARSLAYQTSRVSPNGEWLAFMSDRSLTGYNTHDVNVGVPDEEVYLYHAPENPGTERGTLTCASCDPTGARPVGVAHNTNTGAGELVDGFNVWDNGRVLAANVPGWTPYADREALYQSRYLSDSGRLFFNSSDALVPQDSNGNEDVYEYEPVGVGSCGEGSSGSSVYKPARGFEVEGRVGEEPAGCVALISSGVGYGESAFLDASETGGDVFFLTAEKLVRRDVDTSLNVFDAHVCTARAVCVTEASPSPECRTVEACRAAPSPQPEVFSVPASATFNGPGNVTPEPAVSPEKVVKKATVKCRKGLVKDKKGKCVKRKKAKAMRSAHTSRRARS